VSEKSLFTPFTWKWVEEHLVLKEGKAESPDRDGCDQIAAELNRASAREMLKNEPPPPALPLAQSASPIRAAAQVLGFHMGVPGGWSHGDVAFQKQRRWHDHVLALAEVTRTELERVNPPTIDIGYSKDGPIVRMLAKAIPIITGEHPRPAAIAKKLGRSLK
jgi:hypothetical protein